MNTKGPVVETSASSSSASPAGAPPRAGSSIADAATQIGRRPGAEVYDAVLWRLFANRDLDDSVGYLLGLSSCGPQSGVTTLATNLAIRAADHGMGPVLLADGNVRHPQLHRLMKADRATGLADVLTGEATLSLSVQATAVHGLEFLRLGTRDLLNYARLDRRQFQAVVSELRETYALVFVDLPEADAIGSMLPFAHELDATLLVVRAGRTRRSHAQRAMQQLANNDLRVAGTVVTDQRQHLPNWLQAWL